MPSAERETGGVAVDVVGAGEIGGRQARGLEPADPSELGDVVAGRESPSMIAFRLRPLAGTEPRALTVTVVRYTPQAVLVANVEEARYRALASEDGRLLVEARYAVRNNQRSFLKVDAAAGLDASGARRSAGRPIRPGVAETDAVLLPLEKGRAGEEAPTFVVELVYLQRTRRVDRTRDARASICRRSICRSRARASSCTTRRAFASSRSRARSASETDPGPFAEALRASRRRRRRRHDEGSRRSRAPRRPAGARRSSSGTSPAAARSSASLPVHVTFPAFGPSMFLASELTAEGQRAVRRARVKRAK